MDRLPPSVEWRLIPFDAPARGKRPKRPNGASDHDDGRPESHHHRENIRTRHPRRRSAARGRRALYRRGDAIVRPVVEEVEASHGRKTKAARLRVVEPVYLRDLMDRAANWQKYNATKKKLVATSPPLEVASTLLARGADEWKFPAVAGVISTPTMRPDGSLLNCPGL